MNILLVFFALPIAVIIFSVALQKILKCPLLVASITFAVFLVITFLINDLNYLIATIIYTIISYITAIIVVQINTRRCNQIENGNCLETINTYTETFNCMSNSGVATRIDITQNGRNNCGCRNRR